MFLRVIASALLVTYLWWNGAWLSLGHAPPSLMLALTGLPAPTTGMTRSLLQLIDGNWAASLAWNPFAVPLLALFLVSIGRVAVQGICGRRLELGTTLGRCWLGVLLAAWAAKFLIGPGYW